MFPSAAKPFTARTARSVLQRREHTRSGRVYARERGDAQSEDLWRITGLYAVAFTLAGVARDDGEVGAGDGEDGAAVVGVGVEGALLWLGEGAVWHRG